MKLTVSYFASFITIHRAWCSVDSSSCVSVTIQNLTHVHTNVFCHCGRDISPLKILTFPSESPRVSVARKYTLNKNAAFVGTFLAAVFT
jgi:hypothetical protein